MDSQTISMIIVFLKNGVLMMKGREEKRLGKEKIKTA